MGFRRAFHLLKPLFRSLADAFRPMWDLCAPRAPAYPAGGEQRTENGRAALMLLRIAGRLGLRWRCRRRAYILSRALARDGRDARLRFGVRPAGANEESTGGLAGHVWVEMTGCGSDVDGYPYVVTPHGGAENVEWRRG